MLAVQKLSLRIVGLAGAVIFATFFAFTFSVPGWVEDFAADFVRAEVERQIDRTIDDLEPPEGDSALARYATALYAQNQERIDALKAALRDQIHEQIADAVAQIRDLDCDCRDQYARIMKEGFEFDIGLLQAANDRVVDFIHSTYMEIVAELQRDIRIFTASNAGVFLLLLLVSFLKPRAVQHLFLPAALLLVATAICTYLYVFEQNWLLTIIYSDYLGFAYLAYLGVVFLFLCDIVFNKGRVTTNIINGALEAIGSATPLLPC